MRACASPSSRSRPTSASVDFAAQPQCAHPARAQSRPDRADRRGDRRPERIVEADPRTAKPSWRSATSCARARSLPNARTSTPRRSTASRSRRSPSWVVFYFRGICYERSKQWPKAEADMKKALELFPDQPLVLNYLGYSWVDQGIHLDEGMRMIRRAVEQRADDGYIVDSLGWAYYRHGRLRERREVSRAGGRAEARRPDHQRSSGRRLLAGRAQLEARSSGRTRATSSRSRRISRRSWRS